MRRRTSPATAAVVALAAAAALGTQVAPAAGSAVGRAVDGPGDRWVATWTATPQLVEAANLPPAPFTRGTTVLADATLRQTVHVSVGGSRIRLRLCNTFGGAALPVTAASVALPASGRAGVGGVQAGTAKALTFDGRPSVTVAAGAQAVSDPLEFTVADRANLTVTLYLAKGQASTSITGHPGSRTTSYLVSGDHVADTELRGATTTDHWYLISGLDVVAPAETAAVVVLGDSLTDGRGSTTNGNDRWPDRLLDRLRRNPATATVAVVNQAAGGNRVLRDGTGPSAVSRFERDVLAQPGIRWLIVLEGVNDLGTAGATSAAQRQVVAELTAAYQGFVAKAHAAGVAVYGGTITPFGGNGYDDPGGARESARQSVNTWIRTSGAFDAVIDFDAAVRDPADARRLRAAYDSNDHLHLSPAGYQAMADAVPERLLTR